MTRTDREWVSAHVASCASCRAALDEQRHVAAMLRERPDAAADPGLSARVSARIDREDADRAGWLGLANWRAWTAGLAPVAGALMIVAYLAGDTTRTDSYDATADAPTFDDWTASSGSRGAASVLLQPATSADALLEAVLTGAAPSASSTGTPDVR